MSYEELLAKLRTDLVPQMPQGGPPHGVIFWVIVATLVCVGLVMICSTFYTVSQQHFRIIQRFGRYIKTASPGFHLKWPIDSAMDEWTLEIEETVSKVETMTKDKVSVVITAAVQHYVIPGREVDAYYKLADAEARTTSVVFNAIRGEVPHLELDQLYASKDELALIAQKALRDDLFQFGYEIDRVMISAIEPDAKVKAAMNEISSAQKAGEAELAKAHNEQLVQVARAKGRLEAARLEKEAEIIDAEAIARSVEIIGKSLHENEGYLRYKWIHMMEHGGNSTIYVPTEANLPILEAGKRPACETRT